MTENPFDRLGLKKAVVQKLYETQHLEDFLKRYYHLLQTKLHPDVGGDTGLFAAVNSAYTEIHRHPDRIEGWLSSMQNGTSQEYLAVIEGLVERVQKAETENENLRVKYATILAGKPIDTPKIRTARASHSEEPRVRRVEWEEPEVRAPPRASSARAAPLRKPVRPVEPVVLHDIVLYDAKGRPARKYKTVTMAGKSECDASGNYLSRTQDDWCAYYKAGKDVLPSLPLLYAIIEQLHNTKHPAAAGLLKDMQDSWLCTSTRIDYGKNMITHDYGFAAAETFACSIPAGDHYVDGVVRDKKWRSALSTLLMAKDVDNAIETLQSFSSVRPYIWTASERRSESLRAAFVFIVPDRFYLVCYDDFLHSVGRSRRVAVVGE